MSNTYERGDTVKIIGGYGLSHLLGCGAEVVGEVGPDRYRVRPYGATWDVPVEGVNLDPLDVTETEALRDAKPLVLADTRTDDEPRTSEAMRMMIEFHRTFDLVMNRIPQRPLSVGDDVLSARLTMQMEEVGELITAVSDARHGVTDGEAALTAITDALADIVYAAYSTALTLGIDLDAVLEEVHRSNMSKLGADGKPLKREDGKVIKGPDYRKPNLVKVLMEQPPLW